ncbi:hypothetical protein LSUE1_G001105 [Lachnellula suecica]|uniref:Uncharacterized protein n=1 Tax=Lachnellula suecica TaxID=602035 RepID=A0A8T9CNF7_9HELO|nr:hypothetical protein LSUE1_G001105 [Lachnellula suecica]
MPTYAAFTIYAFGISALIAGMTNLLSPASAVNALGLPESCIPASNGRYTFLASLSPHLLMHAGQGNSLAAIAMGLYYTLAAYQENKTFFRLTVPMRLLTCGVFLDQGGMWKVAGAWECGGAVLTAVALALE